MGEGSYPNNVAEIDAPEKSCLVFFFRLGMNPSEAGTLHLGTRGCEMPQAAFGP